MHPARSLRRAGIRRASAAILVRGSSGPIVADGIAGGLIAAEETAGDAGDSIAEAGIAGATIITATGIIVGIIMAGMHHNGVLS
jgi:hypothetical protein